MKKISVLVPVYNVMPYIERCFNSIKNQTYKNLEVIFVDDCSTDGSLQFLEQHVGELKNAKIIKHEHG